MCEGKGWYEQQGFEMNPEEKKIIEIIKNTPFKDITDYKLLFSQKGNIKKNLKNESFASGKFIIFF